MHLVKRNTPSSLKLKHIIGQLGRSAEGAPAERDLGAEILRNLRSQAKDISVAAAKDRRQLTKARVITQEDVVHLREEREKKEAAKTAKAEVRRNKPKVAAEKKWEFQGVLVPRESDVMFLIVPLQSYRRLAVMWRKIVGN
jgi:hypothetical protein